MLVVRDYALTATSLQVWTVPPGAGVSFRQKPEPEYGKESLREGFTAFQSKKGMTGGGQQVAGAHGVPGLVVVPCDSKGHSGLRIFGDACTRARVSPGHP
jgi:hypothetical protein